MKKMKLILLTVVVSVFLLGLAGSALGDDFEVYYRCYETSTWSKQLKPHFKIKNNSGSTVSLDEFKARYWYTNEAGPIQICAIDYAKVGKANVTTSFGISDGWGYLEIGFTAGAGDLESGNDTGNIQPRFYTENYIYYKQTDDYSFDASKTNFTLWDHYTLYQNDNLVWGTEPADRSYTSPDPVSSAAFKVLINTFSTDMDSAIIDDLSPYLQDGDIICVVHGNASNPVDMDELNSRLDTLQGSEELSSLDLVWVVLCAGHSKLTTIAESLSTDKASYLFYDYEPGWPDWNANFSTTLSNMETAASICHTNGFDAGTAPTGRPLFDNNYIQEEWDYGDIASEMDIMLVQLQSRLRYDYEKGYLDIPYYKFCLDSNKLMRQLVEASFTIEVFPQLTVLSEGNPNGAPLQYCINAVEPIRLKGFPGMSIWWASDATEDVVDLLDSFR